MKTQTFKHEQLTQKKCINSILRFYSQATITEIKEGLVWYNEANDYCKELAARFNISIQQAAGIIAAFSPQAGWTENKRFTITFLYAPKNRVKSLAQTLKAQRILKLSNEADIYNGLSTQNKAFKTKAFFLNILNPDIVTAVTIDRHAIASCIQQIDNVYPLEENYGKLTKNQYAFFENCYFKAAAELDILPQQLQAIVWVVYRRIRELKKHEDSSHWKPFVENAF